MSMSQFERTMVDSMARLETKMDAVVKADADKEKRLRSLERWRWSHAISGAAILALAAKLGIPIGQH